MNSVGCDTELEDKAIVFVCPAYDYLAEDLRIHSTRKRNDTSRKIMMRVNQKLAHRCLTVMTNSLRYLESVLDMKVSVITLKQET